MSGDGMTQRFEPPNPDYERVVRESFARQQFMTTLGARLVEVLPGQVTIEVEHTPALSRQRGYTHGGVVGTIADSAGGYAAYSLFRAGTDVVTVEYKINLMKPATGALLRAVGRVVRPGRTLTICRVDVDSGDGRRMDPVAVMQATFMSV